MTDLKGYLSAQAIRNIINMEKNYRNKLLLKTLWYTGARTEEVVGGRLVRIEKIKDGMGNIVEWRKYTVWCKGLMPSSIDMEEGRIILPSLKKKGKTILYRSVPVPNKFLNDFRDYVVNNKIEADQRIFPLTRQRVFQIVKETGIRAGYSRVGMKSSWLHPHHFRHSIAIHLRKNGMPLETLKEILGHSNIGTTGFYLQFGSNKVSKDYHKIMDKEEEMWAVKSSGYEVPRK